MLTPEQINTVIGVGLLIGAIVAGIWRAMSNKMSRMDSSNQAQLKDTNDALDKLQVDLDKARTENRDFRNRIEELNRQIDSSNVLVREVDRTNAMLQGRLTEQREIYSKQFTDQSNDIAHLKQQVAERDTQIASLKQGVEGKDKTLTDANITIDKLRTELGTEQTAREALTKRVDELEVQVKAMQADKETLIKENSDLKAQNEALTSENTGLKAEILALKLMVTPLPAGVTSPDPIAATPPEVPQP